MAKTGGYLVKVHLQVGGCGAIATFPAPHLMRRKCRVLWQVVSSRPGTMLCRGAWKSGTQAHVQILATLNVQND